MALFVAHPGVDGALAIRGVCSALVLASLVGFVNGMTVGRLRTNSVVTTIGVAFIVLGLTLISTNAQNVTTVSIHPALQFMSAGRKGILPVPGLIFIGITALAQLLLSLTRFGRGLYAAGWNRKWLSFSRDTHSEVAHGRLPHLGAARRAGWHAHRVPRSQREPTLWIWL